jgi:ssDNA-binding Zn-finger/Zn-ribbon topoisomerase 1
MVDGASGRTTRPDEDGDLPTRVETVPNPEHPDQADKLAVRCPKCKKGVAPVTNPETTTRGQARLVSRCPECGWFMDAKQIPDSRAEPQRHDARREEGPRPNA